MNEISQTETEYLKELDRKIKAGEIPAPEGYDG